MELLPQDYPIRKGSNWDSDLFQSSAKTHDVNHDASVFVSSGCCNKSPQTLWLKTTPIYSLTVLGVRSLKSVSLC